jgi:hypothetical protein
MGSKVDNVHVHISPHPTSKNIAQIARDTHISNIAAVIAEAAIMWEPKKNERHEIKILDIPYCSTSNNPRQRQQTVADGRKSTAEQEKLLVSKKGKSNAVRNKASAQKKRGKPTGILEQTSASQKAHCDSALLTKKPLLSRVLVRSSGKEKWKSWILAAKKEKKRKSGSPTRLSRDRP